MISTFTTRVFKKVNYVPFLSLNPYPQQNESVLHFENTQVLISSIPGQLQKYEERSLYIGMGMKKGLRDIFHSLEQIGQVI